MQVSIGEHPVGLGPIIRHVIDGGRQAVNHLLRRSTGVEARFAQVVQKAEAVRIGDGLLGCLL